MSFKWIILLLLLVMAPGYGQQAEQATLNLQPNKCVALHQGRTCYAEINVHWRTFKKGNYCLIDADSEKQLYCWKNSNYGAIAYAFESNESKHYKLVSHNDNVTISESRVVVSWLHKSPDKRRRWRLF